MKILLVLTLGVTLFSQGYCNTLDSCEGRCGYGTDPGFTCQCNSACERFKDCCYDYTSVCKGSAASCAGRCGESYNSQNKCHCNSKCSQHNNCCSDYGDLCGGAPPPTTDISDADIRAISEVLYALDSNKATASELTIDPQALVPNSQTSSKNDLSPRRLFTFLDEQALFSKPTYASFVALMDNYRRVTGQAEDFTPQQLAEQDTFLRESMSNTELGRELFAFLFTKGRYSSEDEFLYDLKMMWFGLYSRYNKKMDSSGFEHIFAGEIKGGKVSGFHNWIQFYLLEKQGLLNYYSHSFNGPWASFPDVLGMQFMWDGYYKQVGSAIIGCSPEFDLAMYSLCYIARPGKKSVPFESGREAAGDPDLHLGQLLLREREEVHRLSIPCHPLKTWDGG
ncbi:uridylate-specific endoribonuclease A isoform X2 [Hypomesus transpacificus]|uniref:uridylate-specific endoribonuclease A isoform X2 n=1 Tax=Hypomesus transpacificus TaxID=137520 RepID=UPI001F0756F7|nr:uridylate-specific endoribonuclease A isoform X2 [Hypomesus transpacificus]